MKLNVRNTFFVGLVFFSTLMFWEIYNKVVPLLLEGFNLNNLETGIIMALDNILAVVLLPFIGIWSDKTKTKIGKRMPFIIVGIVGVVISMIFIPIASNGNSLILFITVLGFVLIFMSLFRSPGVSLMPDITPKPLRSDANAIINIVGYIGVVVALVLELIFFKQEGSNLTLFVVVAVVMLISLILVLLTIDENKLTNEAEEINKTIKEEVLEETKLTKEQKKSLFFILLSVAFWYIAFNAVETFASKYVIYNLKLKDGAFALPLMVAQVGAFAAFIPASVLAKQIGRKKTVILGVIIMLVAFSVAIIHMPLFAYFIVFAFIGAGWATINVNSYPMALEMVGSNNVGKFTGLYYTFSMTAQIITPILAGFLIDRNSNDYGFLFVYAAVFMMFALITMCFVKHGNTITIQEKIKNER